MSESRASAIVTPVGNEPAEKKSSAAGSGIKCISYPMTQQKASSVKPMKKSVLFFMKRPLVVKRKGGAHPRSAPISG